MVKKVKSGVIVAENDSLQLIYSAKLLKTSSQGTVPTPVNPKKSSQSAILSCRLAAVERKKKYSKRST